MQVANAVKNGMNFRGGNTEVVWFRGRLHVYLHGNLIAVRRPKGPLCLTCAGWVTRTTVSRLNAVLHGFGAWSYVHIHKGAAVLELAKGERVILE